MSALSYVLPELTTGTDYYVRVLATSDRGDGPFTYGEPMPLAPSAAASAPTVVAVDHHSASSLIVYFDEDAGDNGSPIMEYLIEWSVSSDFQNAMSKMVPVSNRIQKMYTSAHTPPFSMDSTFTLSLGDFHGDYVTQISGNTSEEKWCVHLGGVHVDVTHNTSLVKFHGVSNNKSTWDLSANVARGGYIRVGGQEFRVCLNTDDNFVTNNDMKYDARHLPLCKVEDAWEADVYLGGTAKG